MTKGQKYFNELNDCFKNQLIDNISYAILLFYQYYGGESFNQVYSSVVDIINIQGTENLHDEVKTHLKNKYFIEVENDCPLILKSLIEKFSENEDRI